MQITLAGSAASAQNPILSETEAESSVQKGFCLYMESLLAKLLKASDPSSPRDEDGPFSEHIAYFLCQNIPKVSFAFFMERFVRMGNITDETMVYAFIYVIRLLRAGIVKNPRALHKLFATAIFVAYKYLNECDIWFLEEFAKLAGMTSAELASCELTLFVDLLKVKAHVDDEQYLKAKQGLEEFSVSCGQHNQRIIRNTG